MWVSVTMGNGVQARVRPVPPGDCSQADTPPDDTTLQGAYERHHSRVFDLCYHYLGQVADAEDAVQETFARAARRLPSLTGDRGAYLLAVARNLCCNELRRRRRVVPVESIDREDRGVEAERGIVERAVLERLWVRLSPRERSLIHDTFAGFSQQEIAGRIGLSPNAVAVALLRARQRARTYASRALAAFFPLALAWRWAQRATRRAATVPAEASSAIALQIQQVGMVITAALVGALTAAQPAGPAVALGGGTSHGAAAGGVALVADGATTVASTPAAGGTAENAVTGGTASTGSGSAAGPVSVLDPIVNPSRNAPQQDVQFTSVTPSPHYSTDHTIFAGGFLANGCAVPASCAALYQSSDGGATWHSVSTDQTYAGGRILLPPAWPQDRTMFAMGTTGLQRSTDGQHFSVVVPVEAPASIAPDSALGNARVLVAANPLLFYSSGSGAVSQGPVLPAGLGLAEDAAFVGDSQHIVVTAPIASTTNPVSGQQQSVVVQCLAASCATVATPAGSTALHLAVSPAAATDHTVVAVSGATLLRSVDGGATFAASRVPVPDGAQTVAAFAGVGAAGGLLVAGFGGQPVVVHVQSGGGVTQMPSSGLPASSALTALAVLADGRVLATVAANSTDRLGVVCLLPGRAGWAPYC